MIDKGACCANSSSATLVSLSVQLHDLQRCVRRATRENGESHMRCRRFKSRSLATICILAIATANVAVAQDSHFYVGVDLGQTKYAAPELQLDDSDAQVTQSFDAKGFGWGFHG